MLLGRSLFVMLGPNVGANTRTTRTQLLTAYIQLGTAFPFGTSFTKKSLAYCRKVNDSELVLIFLA